MRRTLALAFGAASFGSLLACTAILGNYTVGTAGDAGSDAVVGPDSVAPDGDTDGAPDAPAPVPVMKCVLNGSPATIATSASASERLGVHVLKNSSRRVMWVENGSTKVHFTTIDSNLKTTSIVNQDGDLTSGGAMALVSWDGGFAALGVNNQSAQLIGLRLDDDSVVPTTVSPVSAVNSLTSMQDFGIAAAPVGIGKFFVVYSFATGTNVWSMYAGSAAIDSSAGPGTFKLVDDKISARPSLNSDSLVIDTADNKAILFMAGDQGKGATTVYQLDLGSGGLVESHVLAPLHGTSTFQPLNAQTDIGVGVDRVGMAFLEYDLNNPSQPFYAYAGAFPMLGMNAFKPSSLPAPVAFTDTADLAVDKGRGFWKHFPVGGSHVVEAARYTQTGAGVNFLWLDGTGNLRGKASGTTALVPTEKVAGAAGTMDGAPSAVIANAAVTWLTDTGDVRLANVGCAK